MVCVTLWAPPPTHTHTHIRARTPSATRGRTERGQHHCLGTTPPLLCAGISKNHPPFGGHRRRRRRCCCWTLPKKKKKSKETVKEKSSEIFTLLNVVIREILLSTYCSLCRVPSLSFCRRKEKVPAKVSPAN